MSEVHGVSHTARFGLGTRHQIWTPTVVRLWFAENELIWGNSDNVAWHVVSPHGTNVIVIQPARPLIGIGRSGNVGSSNHISSEELLSSRDSDRRT